MGELLDRVSYQITAIKNQWSMLWEKPTDLDRRAPWLPILLLGIAVVYNLVGLFPEVSIEVPYLNDNVLHFTLVERTVDALEQGQNPTDFWFSTFVEGYPLFLHYQHLPHVVIAIIFKIFSGMVPLADLFRWINYLLLATFPVSIFISARWLGFRRISSALAALLSCLVATDGIYGFGYSSYIWRGYGMTTQLWGMWLLAPALARFYLTLRDGKHYLITTVLLSLTLLSHTILGYVAILSGLIMVFTGGWSPVWQRILRLFAVLILVAGVTSYFWLPYVLDRLYMNRSVWEDIGKYNAYGWEWTLKTLVQGDLFDFGRFPSLTILAAVGIVVMIFQWQKDERYRLILSFFIFWLMLYFGRPTWGILIDLLPMSQDLHLHRFIAPVHLAAIALAGCGLAWLSGLIYRLPKRYLFYPGILLLAGLLAPVYIERTQYLLTNRTWMIETAAAFRADNGALTTLIDDLESRLPGRAYAGRLVNWGGNYKIGSVPVYAILSTRQIDNPGYLYHALSLNADVEGYLDENRLATMNLFNLRYVIAPQDLQPSQNWTLLASYGPHRLYEIFTTGYFDLVDSDIALYGSKSDWFPAMQAWILSNLVEQKQHPRILLDEKPIPGELSLPLSQAADQLAISPFPHREACGSILEETVTGMVYQVHFDAERSCWLMLKETFHPGWEVSIDGLQQTPQMLAPSFTGVPVSAGQHLAEFSYHSSPLRWLLLFSGLVWIGMIWVGERQRDRWMVKKPRLAAKMEAFPGQIANFWERVGARLSNRVEYKHILVLTFMVLLAGLPLLQLKQISGHDALEYLPRMVEFYQELQNGNYLPRWAADLSSGYGQPFFIFNPPVIYYLAAFFHFLGASLVASICFTCLLLLLISGTGMYLWVRACFGSLAGLIAGTAFLFSPYLLVNLYVRFALADFAAMAFIPWALFGIRQCCHPVSSNKSSRGCLVIAAIGTALIFLSSNPVSLISFPLLISYGLWLAWLGKSWKIALRGLLAVFLGLGLSSFFLIPAFFERNLVKTANLLVGYLNYRNHFVYLHQLIYSSWGYGLSLPGPEDGMPFQLGIVQLFLLVVSIILAIRFRNRCVEKRSLVSQLWFFVVVLGLVIFFVTENSIWLWDQFSLLQYLEFPWRILALASVALAFICAFPFVLIQTEKSRNRWAFVAILAFLLIGLPKAKPEFYHAISDADFTPETIASQGIGVTTANEYEPVQVQTQPERPAPEERLLVMQGKVRIIQSEIKSTRYAWTLEASGPARIRIATFYFPGWRIYVDNQPRDVQILNPYGMMDLIIEAGTHQVTASFNQTPTRIAAVWISIVSLFILFGVVWRSGKPTRQ